MNFCSFLIILGFVHTITCSRYNSSGDGSCNICTFSFLRRKRAYDEYTRWRANQETTQEFIVKVLDDDITTLRTQNIVAVNIQPLTKSEKKMIVGGAMVPLAPVDTTLTAPIEYTRFVPPTTLPGSDYKLNMASVTAELILLPTTARGPIKSENQISYIKPPAIKNSHRDESPPAGPHFLGRKSAPVQQYAPVAPVSFTRQTGTTIAPLTPRSIERFIYKTSNKPTRTPSASDFIKPTRTTYKPSFRNIFLFDSNDVTNDQMLVSRSSISTHHGPLRTITTRLQSDDDSFGRPTEVNDWRRAENDDKNADKESDLSYNIYNEEDKENNVKADDQELKSANDKKEDDQYEISQVDADLSKATKETINEIKKYNNSTETEFNAYADNEIEETTNFTLSSISNVFPVTKQLSLPTKTSHKKRKTKCSIIKLRQLNFNSPRTLPEIVAQLKQWAETSPVAKWVDITNGNFTTMENPIYMMIVDDPSSGQIVSAKKTVMVIAGIQGRDHHAVTAAMYVLYQLIERSDAHADLLTKYRFWVIPVFNPDGYDYSMTFPHRREWTKNLRQNWDTCKGRQSCDACESFGLRCTIQSCYGVNLDRNFEYQWIPTEELRAEHPCGALYAGARQLSEAETRALTHFLHERRTPLFTFIAFKEGDVLGILYPYSHTRKRRALDHVYRQRASRAASAAYSIGGRPYVAGQTSEFLPLYAGGIEDWVDGHLGIDNTYTVMMFRPTDSYNSKLITERVVHEAYAAMDTLLLQSAEPFGGPAITLSTGTAPPSPIYSNTHLYIIVTSTLLVITC